MGKIKEVNGYVRMMLDKLDPGISGDLVRTDDDWQEWDFPKLLEALRKWTIRNPPKLEKRYSQERLTLPKLTKSKAYQASQQEPKRRPCVFCESPVHQSINCDKVKTMKTAKLETPVLQLHRREPQGLGVSLLFRMQALEEEGSFADL